MFRLISCRRQPGQLVIELKRRFRSEMILPLALISLFLFIVLAAIIGPLSLILVGFGAFYFFYAARIRVFLCYSAGTLRVIRYYDLVFTQWRKQRIYNRAEVPPPVVWVRSIRPGYRSFRLDNDAACRFETRFPFQTLKNGGVICVHPTRERMLALQTAIDDFWAETPYDKAVYERTVLEQSVAAHVPQRTAPQTVATSQKREQKRKVAKFNETRQYAFDRGETPLRRGDEPVTKGGSNAKKQRKRREGYVLRHRSMVQIEEDVSTDLTRGTLKLVSTSGGIFSLCLATLSMFLHYAGIWALIIGGVLFPVMQIWHWEQLERYIAPCVEKLIVSCPTEEMREPVTEAIQWYVMANREGQWNDMFSGEGNKTGAVGITFFVWLAALLIYIGVGRLVRWPFWKRWSVVIRYDKSGGPEIRKPFGRRRMEEIKYRPRQPAEILCSWRHDRARRKEPPKRPDPFFRVIPATPKTNRLLTGRPWISHNPGWKQRHQVVLITEEGAFPLPCAGIDEQEQILERVTRFADGMQHVE